MRLLWREASFMDQHSNVFLYPVLNGTVWDGIKLPVSTAESCFKESKRVVFKRTYGFFLLNLFPSVVSNMHEINQTFCGYVDIFQKRLVVE